jgi:hypothetical protein
LGPVPQGLHRNQNSASLLTRTAWMTCINKMNYSLLPPRHPRTTDTNLYGHAHCLTSRTPTLGLSLEITKCKKFLIQRFIWITKFQSQVCTVLQSKMAQQGRRMRVGVCKSLAYRSVKLVSLVNGNRYEVDTNHRL